MVAAPAIQPASGAAVRQPPQNSAMRRSGPGAGASGGGNPMGMAGLGGAGTNALTLSSAPPANGPRQSAPSGSGNRAGAVRITDTGVTQRTPAGDARR